MQTQNSNDFYVHIYARLFFFFFPEYSCIFPACFPHSERVFCTPDAYFLLKGNSILFLNTIFLHCLHFSSMFLFFNCIKNIEIYFQKLKIEMQLYQDLANILKLVMHVNNSSKFSYGCQPPNTLSLRKEKGNISKTPCIQAFKHSTIHFLLSPHTVNLDLSPKRCQN